MTVIEKERKQKEEEEEEEAAERCVEDGFYGQVLRKENSMESCIEEA